MLPDVPFISLSSFVDPSSVSNHHVSWTWWSDHKCICCPDETTSTEVFFVVRKGVPFISLSSFVDPSSMSNHHVSWTWWSDHKCICCPDETTSTEVFFVVRKGVQLISLITVCLLLFKCMLCVPIHASSHLCFTLTK